MPYSGNLRARWQTKDAKTFPAPDAAHGENATDPYPQKFTAPPGPDMGGTDFPKVVNQNPGLTLNRPGLLGHDGQGNYTSYRTDAEWITSISASHGPDVERGWLGPDSTYYTAALQDSFTSYDAEMFQAYGSTDLPPVILQRGINSNAVNNPPVDGYDEGGFRHGFWRWASVWRTRLQNMDRTYDMQPVYDRNIQVIENSPAEGVFWGSFADSMSRGFTRMNSTPALAREAVDPSAAVEAAVEYGTGADSVIGAF